LIGHTACPFHSVGGRISVVLARILGTPKTSRPGRTPFASLRLDENIEMVMTETSQRSEPVNQRKIEQPLVEIIPDSGAAIIGPSAWTT
jgi:hypothetical protein